MVLGLAMTHMQYERHNLQKEAMVLDFINIRILRSMGDAVERIKDSHKTQKNHCLSFKLFQRTLKTQQEENSQLFFNDPKTLTGKKISTGKK